MRHGNPLLSNDADERSNSPTSIDDTSESVFLSHYSSFYHTVGLLAKYSRPTTRFVYVINLNEHMFAVGLLWMDDSLA